MINRYSRPDIKKIWEEKNKYQIWLDIEIAAAQAMEKLKIIPKGVSSKTRKKAKINVSRIHKIENKVHHDVIAFLTSITEKVGAEGKYLHKGMTSSDILDTCFNIQLIQAGKIIDKDIDEILKVLKNKSLKYKNTICIGRSHGIHAEPTTFGLKLASFYEEFKRNKKRLKNAINEISTCAISGAVGTFANVDYDGTNLSTGINYVGSNSNGDDGLFRVLQYTPTLVQLTNYLALAGDVNGDTTVDLDDFTIIQQNLFASDTNWFSGDLDGNQVTDVRDFNIWNENKLIDIASPSLFAVPEPKTTFLIIFAATFICRCLHSCTPTTGSQ